jgi:ribonuclease VapC
MVLAGAAHSDTVWLPLDAEARFVRAAFINYGKRRHRAAFNFGYCAAYALAKSRNIPVLYNGADFAKTDVASAL